MLTVNESAAYPAALKLDNLSLFISITSGRLHTQLRNAARLTWIGPCRKSSTCDYRFFVDAPLSRMNIDLLEERIRFQDMVFRKECSLMDKYSDDLHYGNSQPTTPHNLSAVNMSLYKLRIFYKIDWKMCFLRWIRDNSKTVEYHIFVEDDSYVCIANLMHQVKLLTNLPLSRRPPFRMGSPMYDGFDDSSTFMSRAVADVFLEHYGEKGFDCPRYRNSYDALDLRSAMWLSWGNSWMDRNCQWFTLLKTKYNVSVIKPIGDCALYARYGGASWSDFGIHNNVTDKNLPMDFPCRPGRPVIIHNHDAKHDLLKRVEAANRSSSNITYTSIVSHQCEYLLTADKIKDPLVILTTWSHDNASRFHDLTPIFTHDGLVGWKYVLQAFAEHEKACGTNITSPPCSDYRRRLVRGIQSYSYSKERGDISEEELLDEESSLSIFRFYYRTIIEALNSIGIPV